jgi:FkbM family methyltransferase
MSSNKRFTSYFNFILLAFSFILIMTIIKYKLYYDNYYGQLNVDNRIYVKIKLDELKSKRFNLRNEISVNETVKNVFIDLGSNKGDSIYNFFGLLEKSQGSNLNGQSLFDNEIEDSFILKTWDVYAFEANEFFNEQLNDMKKTIESLGHTVYLYDKTAACTFNGFIDFYLDIKNKYFDYGGSSLKKNHRDVVRSGFKKSKVRCVDIAEIISKYQPSDIVIVKMDVEGSEYDLLQDFIVKNVSKLIDLMVVEYHDFVSPFKSPNDVFKSLYALQGVKIINWD